MGHISAAIGTQMHLVTKDHSGSLGSMELSKREVRQEPEEAEPTPEGALTFPRIFFTAQGRPTEMNSHPTLGQLQCWVLG